MEASKLRCLLRSWGHSREEDGNGVEVWRPAGYPFPLSRGRDWFELHEDGSATFSGPGPDDRNRAAVGSWITQGDDEFELRRPGGTPPRRLTIVECGASVLRLRPR